MRGFGVHDAKRDVEKNTKGGDRVVVLVVVVVVAVVAIVIVVVVVLVN